MKRKIAMAIMTATMIMSAVPVCAADNSYIGVAGESAKFDKYLVMDKEANVPNASFTYTIEPGTAKTYSVEGKKFEVLAGVGTPSMTDEDTTIERRIPAGIQTNRYIKYDITDRRSG